MEAWTSVDVDFQETPSWQFGYQKSTLASTGTSSPKWYLRVRDSFRSVFPTQWLESQHTIRPGPGLVHFGLHGFLRNVSWPCWRSREAAQNIKLLLEEKSEHVYINTFSKLWLTVQEWKWIIVLIGTLLLQRYVQIFVDRQRCVQSMSSGRFQNLWKCSSQPQKTCWVRRTTVSVKCALLINADVLLFPATWLSETTVINAESYGSPT